MKLNDFASELAAKNHFIKASFGGFQGVENPGRQVILLSEFIKN